MHITLLILILVIAAVVTVVALLTRRAVTARPDHYHWVVRVLGAVLCVAALIAVAVGTWQGTAEDDNAPEVMVMVPTHPAPPPALNANSRKVDLGPCKLVGTVLVARMEQDRFVPFHGESRIIEWPAEGADDMVFHGEYGGATYTVTLNIRGFVSGVDGRIVIENALATVIAGTGFSGTSGGHTLTLDTHKILNFGRGRDALHHAPLSLIPAGSGSELRLLVHLARADRDDPLEVIPAARWLEGNAGKPRQDEMLHNSYPGVRHDRHAPPGVRMIAFLGPAVVLLLVAAVAGSVGFRRGRRAPAFAGLLAGMVLYAGLLDALVLQRRVRLAADPKQPESARVMAMAGMLRGTFFHAGVAASRVRVIANDPSNTDTLRQSAGELVK